LDTRTRYIIIVIFSALIVAFQSVAVEGALNTIELSIFLVAALPTLLGGLILIGIVSGPTTHLAKGLRLRGWVYMILLCLLIALGVFLWFDSIGRIGAGKEALIGGGSSEVLFVVILSAFFLGERLSRWEFLGIVLILAGVIIVLINTNSLSLTIGIGEAEAIVSSFLLAMGVIMVTKLLRIHALTPLSALELFISGMMIMILGIAFNLISWPSLFGWLVLVGLAFFPMAGLLTYNAGLPKIGASITSVLFALCGIFTICAQLIVLLFIPDAELILPQNVYLAVFGGLVAFVGVYMLKLNPSAKAATRDTE